MSIPQVARQYPLSVFIDLVFGDLVLHATSYNLCEVPLGSVVTRISAYVTTIFASAGTFDANVGDVSLVTRYTDSTPMELDATGIPANYPTVTGYKTTASEPNITIKGVFGSTGTSPTAGAMRILIDYITSGRNNENRG